MSNDLISRKALMEGLVENDPVKIAAMCAPTAYDVGAVIEKLEKLKESAWDTWNAIDSEQDFGEAMAYKKAIEIVRNGGMKV